MIEVTTYLSEVKMRNQLRKDVIANKVGAPVANKANKYDGGYIHLDTYVGEEGWFTIRYSARHWGNESIAYNNGQIALNLAQMLHLLGYEVKVIERRKMFGEGTEKIALYRKAE